MVSARDEAAAALARGAPPAEASPARECRLSSAELEKLDARAPAVPATAPREAAAAPADAALARAVPAPPSATFNAPGSPGVARFGARNVATVIRLRGRPSCRTVATIFRVPPAPSAGVK